MKHKWILPLLALLAVILVSAVRSAAASAKRTSAEDRETVLPVSVDYHWNRPAAKELLFRLDSRCHPLFLDELTYHPLDASAAAELLAIPEGEFSSFAVDAFYSCADPVHRAHRAVILHGKDTATAEALAALLEKSCDGSSISDDFFPEKTLTAVCGDMVLLISSTEALAGKYLRFFYSAADDSL